MMHTRLVTYAVAVALGAATAAQTPKTFGSGVTLAETTPLTRIIAGPAAFEGKTVRVEGTVTAVCMHMGCWMALAPDSAADATSTLLIKVDDGVIVFPPGAKGRKAVAEGVVQRIGGGPEGREAASEHARATGKAAAPVAWQLKATGALVYLD